MRTLIVTTLPLALALTACSKPAGDNATTTTTTTTTATETATLDPCSLLTPAEMTAITTDRVKEATADGDTCKYVSDPNDDGVTLVAVRTGGKDKMETAKRAANLLEGMGGAVKDKGGAGADAAAMMKKDSAAVPQLGDQTMWGMNNTLSVLRGDAYVEVTPPLMHDPANHSGYPIVRSEEKRAIAVKVAQAALARLR